MKPFPIQPLEEDSNGTMRFVKNRIVALLLETSTHDLNSLSCENFTQQEHEQFAQLIGYSLGGFGTLSYASDATYNAAELMSGGMDEKYARIESLEKTLAETRKAVKDAAVALFRIHPDDLEE